jgi:hypothetical protein
MNVSDDFLPDEVYTKCHKVDLTRDQPTLDDRDLFGGGIYFNNPKDEALRKSLAEGEIIVGVSSEAFLPNSRLKPIGKGRWKSNSSILKKHVFEYRDV